MFPETKKPRHLCRRPEVLWIAKPSIEPLKANFTGYVIEAGPDFRQRARSLWFFQQRRQLMGPGRELTRGIGSVAFNRFAKPFAGLLAVRTRPHFLNPSLNGRSKRGQARIAGDGGGHLVVVGSQSHIGSNPLTGSTPAIDFVAAVAAILPNQMVALDQLWRGRFWKTLTRLQIDHLMVALQTTRFLKPLWLHRKDPVVVIGPAMLVVPLMRLLGSVWSVRRPLKTRGTALPLMTDRAAKRLHRMGTR